MTTKRKIIKEFMPQIPELHSDSIDEFVTDSIEEKPKTKRKLTAKEKKEAREQKYKEHYEQIKVIKWFDKQQRNGIIPACCQLYRNANTQHLSMGGIMWAKSEGLRSGIPDLTARGLNKSILDIEMKREEHRPKTARSKGGLSELQIERFAQFEACGFDVPICYNAQEAIELLAQFFKINVDVTQLDVI